MEKRKQRRLLTLGVVLYLWAPAIAIAVIVAIEWGWRPLAALAVLWSVALVKVRLDVREYRDQKQPGARPARMLLFAVLLSISGWLVIGGAGIIFGVVFGIVLGLPTPRELQVRRR